MQSLSINDHEYATALAENEFGDLMIASLKNLYCCDTDPWWDNTLIPDFVGSVLSLAMYDPDRNLLDYTFSQCPTHIIPRQIHQTSDKGFLVVGHGFINSASQECLFPSSEEINIFIIKYRYDLQIESVFVLQGSGSSNAADNFGGTAAIGGENVTSLLNGDGCLIVASRSLGNGGDFPVEWDDVSDNEGNIHLFHLDCSNWFDQDCSDCGLTFVEGGDNQDQAGTDCTDPTACNFNPNATEDDGSCEYGSYPYDCNGNCLNDADQNGICDEFEQAAPFNPDANGDGVINLLDMLEIFPLYGQPFEVVPCVNPE